MDDKDIKIDLNSLDQLLEKIANKDKQTEFDFDYPSVTSQASTISQAASSNIWPYGGLTGTLSTGQYAVGASTPSVYTWTTNGTGGTNSNLSPGLTFNDFWDNNSKTSLSVKGDAEFEGDIKLKGKSLNETLDKIEQRLAILHTNEKLEDKWLELKKLGDQYRALEKDILEKEKIWETLKK